MKKLVLVFVGLMILVSSSYAFQPAIIGGIRDGLAIGIMGSNPIARNVALRLGIEANSGKQPLIGFLGGKFYLSRLGRMPMSLGVSAVAYSGGDKSDFGVGIAVILDRFFDVRQMFLEAGIDAVGTGRANIQVGYYIY
jgi:hypothetical protein